MALPRRGIHTKQENKLPDTDKKEEKNLNGGITRPLRLPKSQYDEQGNPQLNVDIDGIDVNKSIKKYLRED